MEEVGNMQPGGPRHDMLVRLLSGELGEELYDNVLLAGSLEQGLSGMVAYVALYADSEGYSCVFVATAPTDLTSVQMVRQIQGLDFTAEQKERQYVRVVYVKDDSPETKRSTEEACLLMAQAGIGNPELPLVFVTLLSLASDGSHKIVVWYPHLAPGDVLLQVLKRYAANAFGV